MTSIDGVLRWTLAAAAASLDDALPELLILAGHADRQGRVPCGRQRYGLLHRAPLADMLTAIGWLGRQFGDVHEFLRGLDTNVVAAVSTQELRKEMERVADVLAKKGIEASWLTDALAEAERIASDKARKSDEIF